MLNKALKKVGTHILHLQIHKGNLFTIYVKTLYPSPMWTILRSYFTSNFMQTPKMYCVCITCFKCQIHSILQTINESGQPPITIFVNSVFRKEWSRFTLSLKLQLCYKMFNYAWWQLTTLQWVNIFHNLPGTHLSRPVVKKKRMAFFHF